MAYMEYTLSEQHCLLLWATTDSVQSLGGLINQARHIDTLMALYNQIKQE